MKILLLIATLLTFKKSDDCDFSSFFPVKPNCTKYEVQKQIGLNSDYEKKSESDDYFDFEYLKKQGLKIERSTLNYKKIHNNCFDAEENYTQFSFADNKLYMISVIYELKENNYADAYKKYLRIVNSFRKSVDFLYEGTKKISNMKDEQIGEGMTFSNTKIRGEKHMEVSIEFKLRKDMWGSAMQNPYGIDLSWVDLRQTKLDNRGY